MDYIRVETQKWAGASRSTVDDRVVVEEPLEIRLEDDVLAMTMRTPGHDRELVLGFLWSEGIITSPSDVASLAHCGKVGDPGRENTMAVTLAPGVKPPVDPLTGALVRRGTITSSACGVCGRKTLDDLLTRVQKNTDQRPLSASVIQSAMAALRERQPLFAETGGCHAASLVTFEGDPLATFEDVGRHNAVDKVVGATIRQGTIGAPGRLLVVSGRASFEIVQKALAAKISAVASVSAPSSLAVSLAVEAGLLLCGFVRGDRMSVYAGQQRVG